MRNCLKDVSANENNPKWENIIRREDSLYTRPNDIRSDFERDYNRIIHSPAFRRMKHKTQVFFSPVNDHICTRMEHIILVESISYTIANYLGLNKELVKAIAIAHDIGHSPFGHQGEKILNRISEREIGRSFWHERNGLEMVDNIITLEDDSQNVQNLNLTYGLRDGIISHCGEIDEESLKPREEYINLYEYNYPNEYKPYTWEGCVVKVADKIAYLGRDIQDAITLGILDKHLPELYDLLELPPNTVINNTVIINNLIYDLCQNSNAEDGLRFSEKYQSLINKIKDFNYKYIYSDDRLDTSNEYFELIIRTIYNTLKRYYDEADYIKKLYPDVIEEFEDWLKAYWTKNRSDSYKNKEVFNVEYKTDLYQAVIYYIAGMTDNYAMKVFNKIMKF